MGVIVIVGAGIVGTCTAHYLAHHPSFNPAVHKIVIIEAVHPACAASGKAGGLLSSTAFPRQIASLSYNLHEELAQEFDGAKKWGYRKVNTCTVEASIEEGEAVEPGARIPQDLDWISKDIVTWCDILGGQNKFSQVHPYYLTNTLMNNLVSKGWVKLITGRVDKIHGSAEKGINAVSYIDPETGSDVRLEAETVVVTTGPWTSKLIESCPIYSMKVPSITIEPTRPVSAYALFTELQVDKYRRVSPEIYARPDEVYICGESTNDPLPVTADLIDVPERSIKQLFEYGKTFSPSVLGAGHIKTAQACYLPIVKDTSPCSGPFIGETNVPHLLLAAGHSCWGINNAPATGKVMAEIILDGRAKSANVRAFKPGDYFDASAVLLP